MADQDRTAPVTAAPASEYILIKAAQRGNHDAYGQLVEPLRSELQAHCYRMLGSNADAEDALQEALVRAWNGLDRFEGRSSLRSWLYRIATNACLKVIERRPRRVLPIDYGPPADPHGNPGPPLSETVWVEPFPEGAMVASGALTPEGRYELHESVELAFVAALQYLPPAQRAVLILRDVLVFSAAETAKMLGTTPTAVYSSLQRARKTVRDRLPAPSQQATLRSLGDDAVTAIVGGYVQAWQDADVAALVKMLCDEAVFSMPPLASWFAGTEAITEFLMRFPLATGNRWRVIPTTANGQLAFGHYKLGRAGATYVAHSLNVVTLRGPQIAEVTAFLVPDVIARFGLPLQVGPRDDER